MISGTHHEMMLRLAQVLINEFFPDKKYYCMFMEKPLSNLAEFSAAKKAEELAFPSAVTAMGIPRQGVSWFTSNIFGTSRTWRVIEDKIYRFDNCYLCLFSVFKIDYGDLVRSAVYLGIGPSKEKLLDLLKEYNDEIKRSNIGCNMVLDRYGCKIENFRKMNWEDIFLPDNLVEQIRDDIDTFFKSEEIYKNRNLVWKRGAMYAGSPGNGKTSICRAIATTSHIPVIYCSLGASPNLHSILSEMQSTISSNAPCIQIFEDADLFAKDPVSRAATLNMMDGLFTIDGVYTVATTNDPEKLDNAFTSRPSRFDSYFVIPEGTSKEISALLRSKIGEDFDKLEENHKQEVISGLKGFSFSFVQEVAVYAVKQAMKYNKPVDYETLHGSLERVINHARTSKEGTTAWSTPLGFDDDSED